MKQLLKEKAALEKRMTQIIRATNHKSSESFSEMIRKSRPLHSRVIEIEATLNRQRAGLGDFLHKMLREGRALAKAGSNQQAVALLDAVGDLPHAMFDDHGFLWDAVRKRFQNYRRRYPGRKDYAQLLDDIRQ